MSTVNANSFYDASGTSNAVLYGVAAPTNSMGFRNRIINGGMTIAQRGTSFSGFSDETYTLDRWLANFSGGGVYSVAQSSDVPAGFTNSNLITVTTADASIGSSDYYIFTQRIEGYNVADLAYGSASAVPITVSFWVKSSVTGTYAVSILAYNASYRSYVSTVTINAANTWEYKSFTLSGDTASVIRTNSNWGLALAFDLGCGSSFNTTAGSWGSGEKYGTSGSTKLISTNGATLYITGVQLEAGSVASPFERRDYGRELAMCQRYYEKSYDQGTVPANGAVNDPRAGIAAGVITGIAESNIFKFSVTKRSAPTMTYYKGAAFATANQWAIYNGGWVQGATVSSALYDNYFTLQISASGFPANSSGIISGGWAASAEL